MLWTEPACNGVFAGSHMASRKRARTAGDGEEEGEAVPVAGGFEAPIFGARGGCGRDLRCG